VSPIAQPAAPKLREGARSEMPRADAATADEISSLVTRHLSLYRSGECGGAAWLRGPRRIGRPLEPDAGNAAEGSEGSMPDWRCQLCDFPRMAFFNHE
jgi:hypothetical protein